MNVLTQNSAATKSSAFISIAAVGFVAIALMFVSGHAQSATLHDAAHDMRHATGFPCH